MASVIEGMEWFVILLVALVVLGPQRLPEMARKIGNWTAEMRRAAADIRQGLEAEIGDVREIAKDIREPLREVQDTVAETKRVIDDEVAPKTWVGPKPLSGPTPEDAMADLERINAGRPVEDDDATPPSAPTSDDVSSGQTESDVSALDAAVETPPSDEAAAELIDEADDEPRVEGGAA
jgi:sec-independent protein translocase protein TatB